MKKLLNIVLIVLGILVISLLTLLISDNAAADSDSKEIADLEYRMNELRKEKDSCFDNLTFQETKDYLDGFTKPCVSWDEEIMRLREKADSLKVKSYEVGLEQNR